MRISILLSLCLALACSPARRSADPEDQAALDAYRLALELLNTDKYEDALDALLKVRAERPSPFVDVAIARSLEGLGRKGLACEVGESLAHDETLEEQKLDGKKAAADAQVRIEGANADCWKTGFGLTLPMRGPSTAPVTILEVAEYQCPYCRRSQATLKQIAQTWPDKVRFAWLSLPLAFHQKARPAARAVAAAQRQGRFWELHDLIMGDEANLDEARHAELAKKVGLDVARFTADVSDPGIEAFVARNEAAAGALGASGTPTFFINGKVLRGAQPFDKFKEAIEAALAEAEAEAKQGTPPERLSDVLCARSNSAYRDYVLRGKVATKASPSAPTPAPLPDTVWNVPVAPGDAVLGPADALVTVVEFSDFQCPFCARAMPTLKQLLQSYGADLRLVYKHNPLPFHADALGAARAAMAAQAQGHFWPMHDKIFESQRDLSLAALSRYAKEIGLDVARFKASLAEAGGEDDARIAADQALSKAADAPGTPTFFINGRKLTGAQPLEAFKAVVDEELGKARKAVDGGAARDTLYESLIKDGKRK